MARRYVGDAVISIQLHSTWDYRGTIRANGKVWHFAGLHAPACGFGPGIAYDSPEAYDRMTASAVTFGAYYSSGNRGAECPEWAPAAEIADAIEDATAWATDEQGRGMYAIRRSPAGQARMVA